MIRTFHKMNLHAAVFFFALAMFSGLSAAEFDSLEFRFLRVKALEGGDVKSINATLRTKADKERKDPLAIWRAEAKENVALTDAFVRVDFTLSPEPGSDIKCRAELPLPEKWDGRLWGQGNSGRAGSIRSLSHYVAAGTAAVTTDLGTSSVAGSGAPAADIVWPGAILRDFHWRATHLMTVHAKRIVEAFYGRAPSKAYFAGGSTGGRQAMSEAIRFPDDYNGFIVSLPDNNAAVNEIAHWHLWRQTHDAEGRSLFTTNEMRIVANAAVDYTTASDPAPYAGKMLSDVRFDEAAVDGFLALAARQCPSLAEGDKTARLKSLYMPLVHDGKCYFNGFAPGSYLGRNMEWFGLVSLRFYMVEKGKPSTRWGDVGWDDIDGYLKERAPEFNASSPDLDAFKSRGGKIIMSAGLEDQTVPPAPIIDYYERVCERYGGIEKTKEWFRLFCIPGCAHGGGKGRAITGTPSGAKVRKLLIDWHEKGIVPSALDTKGKSKSFPMPIAAYPGLCVKDASGKWQVRQLKRGVPRIDEASLVTETSPFRSPTRTAGWENICPERREFPAVEVVWKAPTAGFDVQREDGAEGEVSFEDGAIRIKKTNGKGCIVVSAPAFATTEGKAIRLSADVSANTATPDAVLGYLCAYGAERKISPEDKIGARWFSGGGKPYMRTLVNSAPGMTYRKYTHFMPASDPVTAAIVVKGAPSESVWRNWTAEDLDAAQRKWDEHWKTLSAQDRSRDRADLASFESAIDADIDHTAQISLRDGFSRFIVDGKETPPFVYKVANRDGAQYSGKPLQAYGVKIGCIVLALGELPGRKAPWSERGFDVKMAVEKIRDSMRHGDESLFILALNCSAYPAFTEVEHPDETWRRADGSVVRGNSGSAIPDEYNDGGKLDKGDRRWPWVSYASPAWRGAIKEITAKLVAELQRTGLSKRIVGVHFCGYHDGQFASPVEDHSAPAKAEYERYLAERGLKEGETGAEYSAFVRELGFRALEDFSREAKRIFGKPIVAVRWSMRPLGGHKDSAYDIDAFVRSDAVDVIIPQPTYAQRLPALGQGVRLPCQTLHRHGKMMWYEFDLRTYAALERWAQSVTAAKGLGTSEDFPMWQTVFRKHAGIMLAQRMGWWLYDMAGGWFYPDEIASDCGNVLSFCRELQSLRPDLWHPDAALVVDERAMASYNTANGPKVRNVRNIVMGQWPRLAVSGAPYDFYLAEDVYDEPEILRRYKAVMLGAFLVPDARQKSLMAKLDEWGVKSFVIQPVAYSPEVFNGFVKDAGGYVAMRPGVAQVDMNGDFVSVHCIVPGRHEFRLPFPAKVVNVKSGLEEQVVEGVLLLNMSAGETCWFRLYRIGG